MGGKTVLVSQMVSMPNMEVIKNNKGGCKLLYDGYIYTKKAVSKSTIRWECSQRALKYCKGAMTTDTQVIIVITQYNAIQ